MHIPDNVWQRVIRYIGLEQDLIYDKNLRDWRFERARADINRCWKAARKCMLSSSWDRYLTSLVLLRASIGHTKVTHITKQMKHKVLMADLRTFFNKHTLINIKRVKALQCLRYCDKLSKKPDKFLITPSRLFYDLMKMRPNQFYLR